MKELLEKIFQDKKTLNQSINREKQKKIKQLIITKIISEEVKNGKFK